MNVFPYVYRLVHKSTGQFYIGYRYANKVPAEQDLGTSYFSSSEVIKAIGFEHFNRYIIAEFFDKVYARDHERDMLLSEFGNPLILNRTIPW